jgi:integrase
MAVRKITRKGIKSRDYYVFFSDHQGRLHHFKAGPDKEAAKSIEAKVKSLVGCRTAGDFPRDMQQWINDRPNDLKEKFVKWDLVKGCRIAVQKPLKEHLDDWKKTQRATGVTEGHAKMLHVRVNRIFDECGFRYWNDISGSKLQGQIDCLQRTVRTSKQEVIILGPASDLTKQHFLRACKQFCKWAMQDGRANSNPIEYISRTAAVQRERRALNEHEIKYLLEYTSTAGKNFKIGGPERALLYRFAIETGLRRNEISSLTRTSFDFERGTVTVAAKDSKNRKVATLPLRPTTAARIKEHLRNKLPAAPVFQVPKCNAAMMIKTDLTKARTEWIKIAKDNPDEHRRRNDSDFLKIQTDEGKLDFHALRHTFATMLAVSGVHPKNAQTLMRHSDINLTLSRYSHSQEDQLRAAVNALPEFESQAAVKTGTDDAIASDNYIKNNTIQPALDAKTGHKVAQSTPPVNDINGIFTRPEIAYSEIKTAFLTEKAPSAIIPSDQGPVAQLVRASDS